MLVTPIRVCLETEDYDKAQKYLFQIDFKTLFKEHQSRTLGILLGFQGEILLQKNELDSADSNNVIISLEKYLNTQKKIFETAS